MKFSIKQHHYALRLLETIINCTLTTFYLFTRKRSSLMPSLQNKSKTLVMMNGPSLSRSIDKIKLEIDKYDDKVVTNFFAIDRLFQVLKPNVYVLADPAFFHQEHNSALKGKIERLTKELESAFWPITLYIPNGFEFKVSNLNITIKKIVYNPIIGGFPQVNRLLYLSGYATPHFQNVLIMVLWVSIIRKSNKIEFFGADHDWFRNIYLANSKLFLSEKHFYSDDNKKTCIKINNEDMSLSQFFDQFTRIHRIYEDLNFLSKKLRIEIINKSETSMISAFKFN